MWVAATSTRNYAKNNAFEDWLELYGRYKLMNTKYEKMIPCENTEFLDFLFSQGNKYESMIVEILANEFREDFFCFDGHNQVYLNKSERSKATYWKMKQGIPIIHSGYVTNEHNLTFGKPDFLIRGDYLSKVVNVLYSDDIYGEYNSDEYYICDVKWSEIKNTKTGMRILNRGSVNAFKMQVNIYCNATTQFNTKINRNYGFIFGKNRTYGVIDFSPGGFDETFNETTLNAVDWYRDLCEHGSKWDLYTSYQLKPNHCISDSKWSKVIKEYAKDISDITCMWRCGPQLRDKLNSQGIHSWRDYEFKGELCFKSEKIIKIINEMKILNKKRKNNVCAYTSMPFDLDDISQAIFLDVESINPILNDDNQERVFMIGYGWVENGEYKSEILYAEGLDDISERNLVKKFFIKIVNKTQNKVVSWSEFDQRIINNKFNKYLSPENIDAYNNKFSHIDLHKEAINKRLVVHGAMCFGLKDIVSNLYKNGVIDDDCVELWTSECENGLDAMVKAKKIYNIKIYNKTFRNAILSKHLREIIQYNYIDVKVLYLLYKLLA